MTHRPIVWLAILALSAVALPTVADGRQEQEAVSGGKPLSYWMARLDNRSDTTARAAIKEIGANALPELIRILRHLQPSSDKDRGRALDVITCLGPAGEPALPDILPLMTNQNRQLKIRAFFAFNAISPDAQMARPVLPALMEALGDQEGTMRLAAMNALAALHPPPPEAAPAFVRLLNDSDGMVSGRAMSCLVAQTNVIVLPMLDQRLHDKDSYVVAEAAAQVGVFGAAAAASVPRLKELLDAPLLTVRLAATNALFAITGQKIFQPAPAENANISYNFPGMPFYQVLDIYEHLAGKKVTLEATPKNAQTLRVFTSSPLTKNEAMQLLEDVMKEQAGLVIVHGPDGALTTVAKPQDSPQ